MTLEIQRFSRSDKPIPGLEEYSPNTLRVEPRLFYPDGNVIVNQLPLANFGQALNVFQNGGVSVEVFTGVKSFDALIGSTDCYITQVYTDATVVPNDRVWTHDMPIEFTTEPTYIAWFGVRLQKNPFGYIPTCAIQTTLKGKDFRREMGAGQKSAAYSLYHCIFPR